MINYLIHTTSIWTVLFIVYKILLSKEKYFVLNRMYLIASLAFGLLLPIVQFLDFSSHHVMPEVSAMYHEQVYNLSQLSISASKTTSEQVSINWTSILFVMISVGMAVMLIRNLIAGFKITSLYNESEKLYHLEFTEVRTKQEHLPFSFFRYIFFSAFRLSENDRVTILNHEIHHVRAKHTWDVLFIESIKIFFWWNPLVYLYKKAITENHEYAADHAAIKQGSKKEYCTLLLQSNMPGVNLDLGHPFFSTYIKKRIDMIYRKNSTWKSYLKFALPLVAIIFMAFIINDDPLELDYSLDSDYIDLYADDELLMPNQDYIIDREKGKVIVLNRRENETDGVKYCMFIIDEPREISEFAKNEDTPELMDFVLVNLSKDGVTTVGALQVTSKDIIDLVQEKKQQTANDVRIKLVMANDVKSGIVSNFLEVAANEDIVVVIEDADNKGNSSTNHMSDSTFGKVQHIDIDKKGYYTIAGKIISFKEVKKYLLELDRTEFKSINIKCANDAPFRKVTELLDFASDNNLLVVLEKNSSVDNNIPSISPLAPRSIINRDEKSTGYGMRMHPIHKVNKFHKGIDLLAKPGTPVFVTADGVVSEVLTSNVGYGNHIIVDHQNGFKSLYAHLKDYTVEKGASIERGFQLGTVGSTGMATSPHLHYEVRLNGNTVDPNMYGAEAYLQLREKYLKTDKLGLGQNDTEESMDEKLVQGAKDMFGLKSPLQLDNSNSLIELGLNINRGVIVKAGNQLLTEGVDYEIDYQLGRLKIIDNDFLDPKKPIKVEFASNESDKFMSNDNGKSVVAKKVKSDMTYDGECNANKEGVYFMADKMPTLATCNSGDVYDDYNCTRNELSSFMNANKLYPEAMVEKGFQGMLVFNVVIDESGNIESYKELLREKRRDNYPELVAEGHRLFDLLKSNKKISPAVCNGNKVKSMINLSITYKLNTEQLKRVVPRNASNTSNPNQRAVINYISDQGNLAYYYESKMSVPFSIKVTDPKGEVVLNETHSFLYNTYRDAFFVPNKINGEYIIEVTQDGKTITNRMNCEVF